MNCKQNMVQLTRITVAQFYGSVIHNVSQLRRWLMYPHELLLKKQLNGLFWIKIQISSLIL